MVEVYIQDYTHAETCVTGIGCYVEHYLDRHCDVNAFLESYEGENVSIVNVLYDYGDQYRQYYTICINQALYFEKKCSIIVKISGEIRRD